MLINFIHKEHESGMAESRGFNNVNRILCVFFQLFILLPYMVAGSSCKMANAAPNNSRLTFP